MTDTYKVLGQVESVAGSVVPLYTVPSGKQAVSSSLSIVNTGETGTDYSVFAVPASEYSSVFFETQEGWSQAGQDIDGEGAFDSFGWSVSMSADGLRVAIGSSDNDGGGDTAGHVRVYEWNAGWIQLGADIDGGAYDQLGYSVSISADGNRVAIGGIQNTGPLGARQGVVRVYDWNGSSWFQVAGEIQGENNGDNAGYSVSLSGDGSRVAIGAPYNSSFRPEAGATITQGGHVRIYELFGGSGGSWVQVGADIDGGWFFDRSGKSVSLSADGSRVAIGAPEDDTMSGGDVGSVNVYDWNGSTWVQVGAGIDGEADADRSGESVSLSADGFRVAIGARYNDGAGFNTGHVRIYDWNGSLWVQVGAGIDGENYNEQSGASVSLSADGSRVVIGAIYANNYKGIIRVYEWNGSSWLQVGQNIVGGEAGNLDAEYFGWSVSMSADGSRVASGAPYNGIGAQYYAGHVRVYDFNEYQSEIVPQSKHAIIKSKAISAGVHDEIVGGIQLSAGDTLLVSSSSADVVFNMYGVETL